MNDLCNVLIVIDMQNDFINGSLGSKEAVGIVDNVCKRIDKYIDSNLPIYYTQDTHQQNYLDTFEGKNLPVPHCIDGNYGWRIYDKIAQILMHAPNAKNIIKNTFGTFAWSIKDFVTDAGIEILGGSPGELIMYKGGSIEICGLCTDICVISNALILRAMYPSTDIILHSNCCAGTTIDNHEAALKVMKSCQIEVIENG